MLEIKFSVLSMNFFVLLKYFRFQFRSRNYFPMMVMMNIEFCFSKVRFASGLQPTRECHIYAINKHFQTSLSINFNIHWDGWNVTTFWVVSFVRRAFGLISLGNIVRIKSFAPWNGHSNIMSGNDYLAFVLGIYYSKR